MTLLHCILSGSIENFSLGKMTSLLTNLQVAMLLVEIATLIRQRKLTQKALTETIMYIQFWDLFL